jgi:hypothetical protein
MPAKMMNTTANNHLRSIEEVERFDQLPAPSMRAALATTAVNIFKSLRVSPETMWTKTIDTALTNGGTVNWPPLNL